MINWTLSLTNMTAVTASHIHLGAAGTAPPSNIIFNLFLPNVATQTVNGVVAQGTITNANNANVSLDSLRVLFNNGMAYVNVHTSANPAGEIRGQISPVHFTAALSGGAEVPPVTTAASGTGARPRT